ncbi:MAG: acyl-CoA thioesterase [Brevundimonas sp.]|uniref:acyl-CoA thioesterase n=1 Tax=Brevundimonas sp. TaxID=1871086 RepID=UPI0012058D13|nr:thioesterase family protein [Brevundimonas sp.]RZJ16475.1 MAG: acyl-CoA thioesterase [Brevundimonas sp.]
MSDRPKRGVRADYARFVRLTTRWADNDAYGHVNNVAYYAFIDTAVNQLLIEAGLLDVTGSEVIGVAVESGCRYHASAAYPDVIHAGVRVARVGGSSIRYEIGLFRNDEDAATAEGFFIHVMVARETMRPVAVPDALRGFVEALT